MNSKSYNNMTMHFDNEVFTWKTFVLASNTHNGFLTERITWIFSKCISTKLMRSSLERFKFKQHSLGNLDWMNRLNVFQRKDQRGPHHNQNMKYEKNAPSVWISSNIGTQSNLQHSLWQHPFHLMNFTTFAPVQP